MMAFIASFSSFPYVDTNAKIYALKLSLTIYYQPSVTDLIVESGSLLIVNSFKNNILSLWSYFDVWDDILHFKYAFRFDI